MKYAVVVDNLVLGLADWDGVTEWTPPFGGIAIPVADGQACEAGWIHNAETGQFEEPSPGA